jgi:CBS domain-containing protein
MITDRDIAIRAVAEGRSFDTPVREVMSEGVEYVFEDDNLDDASVKMADLKVRRLPVLNRDQRLVGILSLGDVSQSGDPSQAQAALAGSAEPGGPHSQS